MPKYDAFGREIGEDSLSGLGSGASAAPAPAPAPAPAAEPVTVEPGSPLRAPEAQPAPSQPIAAPPPPRRGSVSIPLQPPRRRRRGLGVGIVLFVLFVLIAPLLIGAIAVVNTVDKATESVRGGILEAIPATPEAPAVAPKGIAGRSLVRRDHLAAALRKLSSSELRLTNLRLAPERIDVQLLTRGGRLRSRQVQPGGAIRQFGPDSGPGFDRSSTIPFARLNPGAPQRLARTGAAKLHVRVSTLQYLVPTMFSGKLTWAAYFKRGRYVLGDAAGRFQRAY